MESDKILKLKNRMLEYYKGDPKRINHFLKVYSFALIIGESEKISERKLYILSIAALVHDIGIKEAEKKYGSCNGKQQEIEGPPIAEKMLREIGFENEIIDRVCFLVGHHHTYLRIDDIDFQILVEADFLVNFYEEEMSKDSINKCMKNVFKTSSGIKTCISLFG